MDISLDSSVEEHLTSDVWVTGLIPGPAIYFHLYFFVFVHSSHPYYNWNILFYTDYCGEFWRSTAYTSCRGRIRKACYQRKQVGHNICVQNKNISCCQKDCFSVLFSKDHKILFNLFMLCLFQLFYIDLNIGFLQEKYVSTCFVIY